MKLRNIPLDKIVVPKTRVTAVYDADQLQLLRDSLAAMGTVQPIVVVATDGGYEVVDGLHRAEEARKRGETTINAVVYEGSPQDTLLMNLVLNRVRGKVRASEMVAVIAELWQSHQLDSDAIAAKTGLTRDYIERLQRISQAAPSVQAALDQEIIGVGHAYELSRLPSPLQQEEMLAKHQVWRYSVKELHEFVDEVLRQMQAAQAQVPAAQPPPVVAPPQYFCEGCKKEIPPRYLRPVMVCPECFGRVWQLAQAHPAETVQINNEAPPA